MPYMARVPQREDSPEQVGARLRLIRIGYGMAQGYTEEMSQAEFCRLTGIGRQAWNNAETGDNRLGHDNAMKLWRKTGVGLDYVYHADARVLPHALLVEISKIEAAEATSKPKRA
jgi:hypothetical protein